MPDKEIESNEDVIDSIIDDLNIESDENEDTKKEVDLNELPDTVPESVESEPLDQQLDDEPTKDDEPVTKLENDQVDKDEPVDQLDNEADEPVTKLENDQVDKDEPVDQLDNEADEHDSEVKPPLPERHNSISSNKSGQSIGGKSLKSWFNIKLKSANGSKEDMMTDNTSVTDTVSDLIQNEENFDLLLSRLHNNDGHNKSAKDREQLNVGTTTLKNTFNEIKQGIHHTNNDELIQKIDWEFWSKVANNYAEIVTNEPDLLLQNISNGIPNELRGMIWQLIANSKSFNLEELFRNLKLESSQHERAIKRDLSRTRFMNNEQVKDKVDEVFNIIKAYSLYDPEVGYTQGMAFITVPLLMNMSESESFCLLCTLMKNYDFRSLYLPEMPGLVLKLYQFDRLLEDLCPQLYNHLIRQGIRSSMYATQWFLTLFGYKFPLDMVLRIYDIVILEGLETILKFAVNLMIQNKDHLISLPFDELLKFLKDNLFYHYLTGSTTDILQEITIETYRLDDLVKDSMEIKILPITLKKYELEFEEIHRLEKERDLEVENLKNKNGQLTREIRKLENSYSLLNLEHVEIANEMIQGKVKLANLEDENKILREQIQDLTTKLADLEKDIGDNNSQLQKDIDLEISKTMQRNLEVMEMNRVLEEQLGDLEINYNQLAKEFDGLNVEHVNLKSRLRNLMG